MSDRAEPDLATPAQLATKRWGRPPRGILSLTDGVLRFNDAKRGTTLEAALTDLGEISGPHSLGTAFRFQLGGRRYTAMFYDVDHIRYPASGAAGTLATSISTFGELGSGRSLCAAWLHVLGEAGARISTG